ncbi:hypothetical protein HMPREF0868_0194 [Mageeibacillus indolicus UPII9-5]|uniref:Uncharacterized protein n=1 Tax=Mageeibacillus indolicus (strain UPII9-5) TaxID=699246 RepID=D3R028_MAGIU|nr:hypothetical protein HMPREF0868_0194 [Mageeibacillus indolicus UPII9-5]
MLFIYIYVILTKTAVAAAYECIFHNNIYEKTLSIKAMQI